MTRHIARLAVILVCLGASMAVAQYCPFHEDGPPKFVSGARPPARGSGSCLGGGGGPPPPLSGGGGPPPGSPGSPGGSMEGGSECVGDPVTVFGTRSYTFDRIEDVMVQTPLGPVSFQRSYVSSDLPWRGGRLSDSPTTLEGVPKPFGASRVEGDKSQRWSHNFFALVDLRPSEWRVRAPRGSEEVFAPCTGLPCWAPRHGTAYGEPSRLYRRTDGSFLFLQNDGRQYVFAAATSNGGKYFLSEERDIDGRLVASVNYARPTNACPGFLGLSDSGVPYVSTIVAAAGPTLALSYGTLGSPECVVTGLSVNDAGVASYVYQDGVPGHLVGANTLQFFEGYSAYQSSFVVFRDAGTPAIPVVHALDAGAAGIASPPLLAQNTLTVVRIDDVQGSLGLGATAEVLAPFDGGSRCLSSVYACCDANTSRRVDVLSATRGDGSGLAANYTQRFYFSASQYSVEGHQPEMRVDLCTPGDYSCSPGHIRWLWQGAVSDTQFCSSANPG